MQVLNIYQDAYPEQLEGALRDELRRLERVREARDAAVRRRRERWAEVRARLARAFRG